MIKTKIYNDPRPMKFDWVNRCICGELFNGFKGDFLCGDCCDKPEVYNENEENTRIVNEELGEK